MTLISSSIPNFVQGVSQQPAALRLASQVESQLNGTPSLVEGLLKRPPMNYVAQLLATSLTGAKIHFSARDLTDRFSMVVTDGDIKVYEKDTGTERTVTYPDGKTYLDIAGTPDDQFRLLTVADTTYVANRETTVAMTSATSTDPDFQALVAVKTGDYSTRYVIYVDGSEVANYVTSDTAVAETRTDAIATELTTDLNAALPGTFDTVVSYGSAIRIQKTDGSRFEISSWDSRTDDALTIATDRVQRFTDLPNVAPDGYICEVVGDQTNNFDNYFVVYDADDNNSAVGSNSGVWRETIAPGITYALDATTMPHTLTLQSDGTFIFAQATWGDRIVGDATISPDPSFVGNTVNGMAFFQNRFGILADDNVILTETGGFFNFWRKTAKAVLDTDPIDVAASYGKVAILYHAIAFDKKLICFSDQSRWALSGAQVLTPSNVSFDLIGEDAADSTVQPAAAGNSIYFATPRGNFSTLLEMQVRDDTERSEALDIGEHVPTYIPANIKHITTSNNEKTLAVLSADENTSVYVYNWHWSGKNKDQAAWHKFTLNVTEILNIEFFESELWAVVIKGTQTLLVKIILSPGQTDVGQAFNTLLDFKMDETVATPAYDAGTGLTTVTIPVLLTDPVCVLNGADAGVVLHEGSSGAVTTFTIVGDYSSDTYFVGERYTFKTVLSEIVYRATTKDGRRLPIVAGRLQLKFLSLLYFASGYFKIRVTAKYRAAHEYIFTGRVLGDGGLLVGGIPIINGTFRVPVKSKSDRVDIDLESNSFLPCKFLSADWEGVISIRARRA